MNDDDLRVWRGFAWAGLFSIPIWFLIVLLLWMVAT